MLVFMVFTVSPDKAASPDSDHLVPAHTDHLIHNLYDNPLQQ